MRRGGDRINKGRTFNDDNPPFFDYQFPTLPHRFLFPTPHSFIWPENLTTMAFAMDFMGLCGLQVALYDYKTPKGVFISVTIVEETSSGRDASSVMGLTVYAVSVEEEYLDERSERTNILREENGSCEEIIEIDITCSVGINTGNHTIKFENLSPVPNDMYFENWGRYFV